MDNIITMINDLSPYITLGFGIIILILLILIYVAFKSLNSLEKRYRKLMRGVNNKNLEEIIMGYMDKVDNALEISENTKTKLNDLDIKVNGCIQRIAIVRYKAFDDVGSDLSFSVAFLDNKNNGVILTGIYGRHESTTYAKPIDKGISRYELSDEEKGVLKDAMTK